MASSFFPNRGCVYRLDQGEGSSPGFYSVEGLQTGKGMTPILLMGVRLQDNDLIATVATLSNSRIIYKFGKDFGNVGINGIALLGPAGGGTDSFGEVVKFFDDNRIIQKDAPVNVSLGTNKGYAVYLSGLVIAEADPEFNTQAFVLTGILAEPAKKK